jgi:hypothetical protein
MRDKSISSVCYFTFRFFNTDFIGTGSNEEAVRRQVNIWVLKLEDYKLLPSRM